MKLVCYVCNNPIQSNDYTIVPHKKGEILYRHKTRCYPNTAKWNKNTKLKKAYKKQFKGNKK